MTDTPRSLHANFVVINNTGILIQGKPGIGKSELTLELIRRGHRFVADDLTFLKDQGGQLIGQQHPKVQDILTVRGIGAVCIQNCFSAEQVLSEHTINLVVSLYADQPTAQNDKIQIGSHLIPHRHIAFSQGRCKATLLETLAKQAELKTEGKICGRILANRLQGQ